MMTGGVLFYNVLRVNEALCPLTILTVRSNLGKDIENKIRRPD